MWLIRWTPQRLATVGRVAASHNLEEGSMTHYRTGIGQVGWLSQAARR